MAGNAINWRKPNAGPYKGQVVYVSQNRMNPAQLRTMQSLQGYGSTKGMTNGQTINYMLANGFLSPMPKPAGVAQAGGAIVPKPVKTRQPRTPKPVATPTPSAQPMDMVKANTLYQKGLDDYNARIGPSTGGYIPLGRLYTAQGFHAKPDVLDKAAIDSYVAKGEIQVFRGTEGIGKTAAEKDAYSKAYRDGAEHYPGFGIYGNGTYTAGPNGGGIATASAYTNGSGTILRMTIKADAKIATYSDMEAQRTADLTTLKASPAFARSQATIDAANARYYKEQQTYMNTSLPQSVRNAARNRQQQAYRVVAALEQRQIKQFRTAVYQDAGSYAVAKGYDVIHAESAGYYVILNRGATRVQNKSLPGSKRTYP